MTDKRYVASFIVELCMSKKTTKNARALRVLKSVFKNPFYFSILILVALVFFLLTVWLPNASLIQQVILSEIYTGQQKMKILWTSLGFIKTNFTPFGQFLTLSTAILAGLNLPLLTFYLKKRIRIEKSIGTGLVGTVAGLVGVGCASCGSITLSSLFGIGASSSFIGFFPLKGTEFGILGILLLTMSNFLLIKKIDKPYRCNVQITKKI